MVSLAEIGEVARMSDEVLSVAAIKVLHEFYGEDYHLYVTFKDHRNMSASNPSGIDDLVNSLRAFFVERLV